MSQLCDGYTELNSITLCSWTGNESYQCGCWLLVAACCLLVAYMYVFIPNVSMCLCFYLCLCVYIELSQSKAISQSSQLYIYICCCCICLYLPFVSFALDSIVRQRVVYILYKFSGAFSRFCDTNEI